MKEKLYYYRAKIVSVYDGDTCRADIDLGMGIWVRNEKLRLLRINAPEMRGDEKAAGKVSRDFLRELVLGREVFIQTWKDRRGKYGVSSPRSGWRRSRSNGSTSTTGWWRPGRRSTRTIDPA